MTVLKTAIATYPHTKALKAGRVTVPGAQLEHIEITPIRNALRRMCRGLEFDVCEMAVSSYLTAKAYGKAFTALPLFVMRQSAHTPLVYNTNSGVRSAKDLEGKKVGVRGYTVTTGVWVRGILATEYGVDLDKVTWVAVDEEHVEEYHKAAPSNVVYKLGGNLAEMVSSGELAAAVVDGRVDAPDVKPLIPNAAEAETAWYHKTGIYPVNHMVVVKDSLLHADPTLAPRLFNAFKEAKAAFLAEMRSGAKLTGDARALAQRRDLLGDDPLPYGVSRNRTALEAIIQYVHDQKIVPYQAKVDEMFASGTLDLE